MNIIEAPLPVYEFVLVTAPRSPAI